LALFRDAHWTTAPTKCPLCRTSVSRRSAQLDSAHLSRCSAPRAYRLWGRDTVHTIATVRPSQKRRACAATGGRSWSCSENLGCLVTYICGSCFFTSWLSRAILNFVFFCLQHLGLLHRVQISGIYNANSLPRGSSRLTGSLGLGKTCSFCV
jgi:hypothetical protein